MIILKKPKPFVKRNDGLLELIKEESSISSSNSSNSSNSNSSNSSSKSSIS
jgi:hypothetical protein